MESSGAYSDRPWEADEDFFIPDLCAPPAVLIAVLLAELVVLMHVLALGPLASFAWRTLATGSLFVQWNTLLCLALICALRARLRLLPPAAATLACLLLVVGVCVGSSLLAAFANPMPAPPGSILDGVLRNALLALLLAAIVLRYAYLQQRVARQRRSELQLRLDALRARIRPHFLFNTLNSIASLIAIQPERAERAVEDVAELLRAALQADDRDSTLGQERRLCELYLGIEQFRLGERLATSWDVDSALDSLTLPALLLQPLVENAVYHGVAQRAEGGLIRIAARVAEGKLSIVVESPLPARPASRAGSGQHMGLDNIRQRLSAQYGDEAGLETGPRGENATAQRCACPPGAPGQAREDTDPPMTEALARGAAVPPARAFAAGGRAARGGERRRGARSDPAYGRPQILLLDIRMPEMDGVAVARELLRVEEPPALVFCTAYDEYAAGCAGAIRP